MACATRMAKVGGMMYMDAGIVLGLPACLCSE
jgi:hypothetical protein